jgi:hypothetical protein
LVGDFHNGPLSVLVPFGLWGAIAWLWFLAAALRVLYFNYKYGDPALRHLNTFFFAVFLMRTLFFFVVFGGIESDMLIFAGLLGLSVSLNGGVARPQPAEAPSPEKLRAMATILPRVRPAL